MKKLVAILIFTVLLAMTVAAFADTYTFESNDGSGIRTNFQNLDHCKAYLWSFKWKPAADEVITGATLSFSNIRNWNNRANWLGVYLIADTPATGGTTGWRAWSSDTFDDLTPASAVFQKRDYQNVGKPFNAVANKVLVGAYSDTRHGSFVKDNPVFDFAHPALISSKTPAWGWNIYDDYPLQTSVLDQLNAWSADADWALGIDPDCHFYNGGVTLTITTEPKSPPVPEPISIVLGSFGLVLVSGFRKMRNT